MLRYLLSFRWFLNVIALGCVLAIAGVCTAAPEPTLAPPEGEVSPPPLLVPSGTATAHNMPEEVLPAPLPVPVPSIGVPPKHHPWARFKPGAWRRVQILNESFDQSGVTLGRSTTERIERLEAVETRTYRLRTESIVGVGGKRLPSATQQPIRSLLTDSLTLPTSVEEGEETTISLQGQAVPCTVWHCVTPIERGERQETIYYSSQHPLHVLRRERIDQIEGELQGESTTNLVRNGLATSLHGEIAPVGHQLTTTRLPGGGRREVFQVLSIAVPGGVVSSSEVEYGPAGQRTRWTATHLIDSGLHASSASEAQALSTGEEHPSQRGVPTPGTPRETAKPESPQPDPPKEFRPRRLLRLLRRTGLPLPPEESALEKADTEIQKQ